MSKVLLIDGNSLTYRAFFALPTDMATASGQVTNAVFGFTSMLINLIRDHKPDQLVVTFDLPEPTFRHKMVDTYKANREASPDILRQQMGLVRQVVASLGIPIIEIPGFEADDVIATLATQGRDLGDDILIVTGDRDSYQLVEDPHVKVLYNKRGVSDYALYDEAGIVERTGVHPTNYVQYAALRGDPSDNLPGVPGVGEKTAAKLINKYDGIDGIYQHLDEQTPKLRENLAANEAQVRSNLDMMVLRRDVALEQGPLPLDRSLIDFDEVRTLFDFLEFRTLFDRLLEALGEAPRDEAPSDAGGEAIAATLVEVREVDETVDILAGLVARGGLIIIDAAWQGVAGRSALDGLAIVTDIDAGEVTWIPSHLVAEPAVADALSTLVGPGGNPVAAHGAKEIMRGLDPYGITVNTLLLDTMIAAYLLEPSESRYLLDDLLECYVHRRLPEAGAAPSGQLDFGGTETESSASGESAARALGVATPALDPLLAALDARGLRSLNDSIEVPLVRVLARMEIVGVGVDADELRRLNDDLIAECDRLRQELWNDAGEEFNVNSTPQLREILFDRLGLTPQKKTKTGFSTDVSSLEKLLGEHPIIEHLLRYREVEKLRSTYGEGLLAEVAPDGRIHATFNQTVARTGRLSSDAPNLHNIPVRSETGRSFRRVFVPAPGHELLVADYNQIELRCIAHLAEDPGLIEAFETGQDIHTATVARIFGVDDDAVSVEQRSKSKMVSYGLAYGMESYGLAQRLSIPVGEAQQILDAYFVAFPSVRQYMEDTVAEARERGYTETLFGRRRQIPELSSPNFRIRQAGERQAMNAGIQGLAADIFKVALVRLDAAIDDGGFASRVILQVHDEVLVEVVPEERNDMTEVVLTAMSGAFDLRVPLEVNLSHGLSWAAAKG